MGYGVKLIKLDMQEELTIDPKVESTQPHAPHLPWSAVSQISGLNVRTTISTLQHSQRAMQSCGEAINLYLRSYKRYLWKALSLFDFVLCWPLGQGHPRVETGFITHPHPRNRDIFAGPIYQGFLKRMRSHDSHSRLASEIILGKDFSCTMNPRMIIVPKKSNNRIWIEPFKALYPVKTHEERYEYE